MVAWFLCVCGVWWGWLVFFFFFGLGLDVSVFEGYLFGSPVGPFLGPCFSFSSPLRVTVF